MVLGEEETNKMAYTAKDPRPPPTAFSVPNINVLYLRETKLWRCERGGRGETCHLLTHTAMLAGVGKNQKSSEYDYRLIFRSKQILPLTVQTRVGGSGTWDTIPV